MICENMWSLSEILEVTLISIVSNHVVTFRHERFAGECWISSFILQEKKLSEDNVKDLSDDIQVSQAFVSALWTYTFWHTEVSIGLVDWDLLITDASSALTNCWGYAENDWRLC